MTTPDLVCRIRRCAPFITLSLVAFGSVCLPTAAAQTVKMSFNVPSDAAERSLKKFSAQSGREVLFDSDAVGNVTTNAVKGDYVPREALDLMLAGTKLIATEDDKTGAFRVQRSAPQADPAPGSSAAASPDAAAGTSATASSGPTLLSPFEVDVSKDTGYLATTAATATRIGTPIIDTPINIQVIDSSFLQDTGVNNFENAFHYTSGVFVDDQGYFRPQGSIKIRGFAPETIYRNGFPEYYNFSTDSIERIEVIKGPSAVYFGREDPGGIINYVTKEPQFINQNSTTFTVGSSAYNKGLIDSQVVSGNKELAVRVVASAVHSQSFLDAASERSNFALISATYRPSSRFELKFDFEHYENYDTGTGPTGLVYNPAWVAAETGNPNPLTLGQWQVQQFNATGVLPAAYTSDWYPRGYRFNKDGNGSFEQGRTNIGDLVANLELTHNLNLHVALNHVVTGSTQALFLNSDPGQLPVGPIQTHIQSDSEFSPAGPTLPADDSVTSLNYGFNIAQWTMVFDRPTVPYLRDEQINQNVRNTLQADLSYEFELLGAKHTFVGSYNYSDDVYVQPFMLLNASAFPATGIIPGWSTLFAGSSPFSQWISPFQTGFGTPANGWDPLNLQTVQYSQIPNLKSLQYKLSTQIGAASYWGGQNSYDKDLAIDYQGSYWDDRINVLLGIRDNIYDNVGDNQTGYTSNYYVATATTLQGGFTVRITRDLVFYAGASQSFLPQGTINPIIKDAAGNVIGGGDTLKPEQGRGWDFGLKTDFMHNRLSGSLSIFDVDRFNIVQPNSTEQNVLTAAGDSLSGGTNGTLYQNSGLERTQGVELDLVYTPIPNDQVVFDYSYYWTHAIIQDVAANINVGHGGTFVPSAIDGTPIPTDLTQNANRHNLAEVPATLAGIWNKYTFTDDQLKGLSIGLGVNFQGAAIASQNAVNSTIINPAVFLVDALVGYDTVLLGRPTRFAINANNLLNKHYTNNDIGIGTPLTWLVSATVKF
jgi:outer membrane receptor protein involved in Fe transport